MKFTVYVKKRKRKVVPLVFCIVLCAVAHLFSMWQLDLIVVKPVWAPLHENIKWFSAMKRAGYYAYSEAPFQCFLWRTTVGEAYDTLFLLNFLSFIGVIVCFLLLLKDVLEMVKR